MPQIVKGATDVTRYVMLRDSAAGTPETAYTITSLDLQYTRNRTAPAAKVDATALAATDSAHGDNQAIEVNATSSPGLYRIDWPDAAFATGVDKVLLVVSGTGLDPAVEEIELVDFSLEGQSAIDLKDFADAGYDPATNKVQGVVLVDALHADYDAAKTAASQTSVNTAQADLDILTGSDGVTLATAQANYAPLKPTTAGRTLDVTATGAAGIDWGNVENPTTAVVLSGTTVGVVTVNTDMRGTDSAALATVCTEARLAELDAANLPTDIAALATAASLSTAQTAITAIKAITDAIGATAAANLARTLSAAGTVFFTAQTGTLSTTQATTDLAESTNDHYIGRTIIWLTGALAGQATDVTDYVGTGGLLTFTALTESPANGDTGILV